MKRYRGNDANGGRIAVIANDAIGNFVVSTPLLQLLRTELKPRSIHYFGGVRTAELQAKSDLFEANFLFHGTPFRQVLGQVGSNNYDLVINLENSAAAKTLAASLCHEDAFVVGPAASPNNRGDFPFDEDAEQQLAQDPRWVAPDLTSRYGQLKTGFIGEIFCRMSYLSGDLPGYKAPSEDPNSDIPDVLIACSASLHDKLWTTENWRKVSYQLKDQGKSLGLLGAAKTQQSAFWLGIDSENALVEEGLVQDLRGKFTLPQVVGALARAKQVVTLDNGIMHLAVAAGTPTIGLFREGIHRLWAPPSNNLNVAVGEPGEPVSNLPAASVTQFLLS